MAISKRKILKTTMLPGIWPRLKDLFGSGFGYLAYIIAVVYNTVRILPNGHAYLATGNIGTYSIRQAIAAAANNITLSRNNIDQIIIFFSIISALIIMFIQFILLIVAMVIPKAIAQTMPTTIEGFFVTPSPENDIAFRMLDLVFGVPGFFGSREATETAMHTALHGLFEFYSIGILIVGSIIIIYLVVAIVAETAQSGIPFGQRFNKSWAPVRLILFFGLIIPVSYGLNGGQWIALASAKLGSGLASTGWVVFNEAINDANETLTGRAEQNVGIPHATDLTHLPGFMMLVRTCKYAYDTTYNTYDYPAATWDPTGTETGVQAWAVINEETIAANGDVSTEYTAELITNTTFQNLADVAADTNIAIVFGVKDENNFSSYKASVSPVCGEIAMRVTDVTEPGSAVIHTAFYDLISQMWAGIEDLDRYAQNYVDREINIGPTRPNAAYPDADYVRGWERYLDEYMNGDGANVGVIREAVEAQIANGDWTMPAQMRELGWGGAGIYYNKIAQQNGALVSALQQVPMQFRYPAVMELVAANSTEGNSTSSVRERFDRTQSSGNANIVFENPREEEIADTLSNVYKFWYSEDAAVDNSNDLTNNSIIDTINLLLGAEGLFEICENTDIHPLAQLSVLGKSLLDRSIQSFAISGALGVFSVIPTPFAQSLSAGAAMFSAFAGVGLLIGFVLFYVLPFLPFLYFFFAVGNWVKGIFEAVVAMPLWALAHLRIDGEGIPGEAAIGGYFLIFEIFIRPILIVFGLLAAVTVFAAMVKVMNEVFYLLISNVSGSDPRSSAACFTNPNATAGQQDVIDASRVSLSNAYRGPVDEFFFTIVYTILVYMIGTTCFKMIDMLPNEMLRWINAEIPAFNDSTKDSAEGLMKYVTMGGAKFGSQIGDSVAGIGGGVKESVLQFTRGGR